MNDSIKDGGPAFPVSTSTSDLHDYGMYGHQDGHTTWQFGGMTLRDYFAAKAMQSFMQGAVLPPDFDAAEQIAFAAQRAYEVADAMLRAREVQS